jgi:hypothetical protein
MISVDTVLDELRIFTEYDRATLDIEGRTLVVLVGEPLSEQDAAWVREGGFRGPQQPHPDDPYEWRLDL